MSVRIRVDRDLCTGHALCHLHGPDVYILDDLGYNATDQQEVPPDLWEQARKGALACPEGAILVVETGPDEVGSAESSAG
jgi:ferredoxin